MSDGQRPPETQSLAALYICYFPLSEPLVETQVLSYLRGLAAAGHRIHLLTYETERRSRTANAALRDTLARDGITWHRLRYHKSPSLPATIFDAISGIVLGAYLVRRRRLDLVHLRTHVPGAMGLAIRRVTGCRLLFDIRGLMAEEYVDAGTWKSGGAPYRLTKTVERKCIAAADGVVVLTERARTQLFGDGTTTAAGAPVKVIPSCVDVGAVERQAALRSQVRASHGFSGDAPVLVYAGKFSTWYMAREMAEYFAEWRRREPKARFLVLTQSDPQLIREALSSAGVPPAAVVVTCVAPSEVGAQLAAADVAISFIRPQPSKIASSPTKIGEYLAAGLPVVVGAGVGDTDPLILDHQVGVVIDRHDRSAYAAALAEIDELRRDPELADRARQVARSHLSLVDVGIPRYRELYACIAARRSKTARR